jgi:hypothetical protein
MTEIIFSEKDHSYTVQGVTVPSVTTILAALGFYGNAEKYFTDYSRDRGRFVHRIIEYHLAGELDESTIDPALEGYFQAWKRFEIDTKFFPTITEKRMFSPLYHFAGTPDHIGKLNGRESIVDVKTGLPGYAAQIQTAGYEILHRPSKRFSLQLKADGKYKLTEYADRKDREIFLSALAVYQWQQNHKLRKS